MPTYLQANDHAIFCIPIPKKQLLFTFQSSNKMQRLEDSLKYRTWATDLKTHGVQLKALEELSTIRKRNGEILFSLVKIDAQAPEGNPILPIVMLRGNFVSVLTCLIDRETREEFMLLVCQRRVANGALFYEHPAGMCDSQTDPYAVALIEVSEETGMTITRDVLHLHNEDRLYSSPGLLDEAGYFFSCELELDRAEIDSYHMKRGGHYGEGEFIHTYIATPAEAKRLIKNVSGLLATYLYEEWKAARALGNR
jgi:ADP-sugar diphosphatase